MDPSSETNTPDHKRNPLIPIGIVVLGILTLPVLFYSTGPDGPVKEGDVVFSTAKHQAYFFTPNQYELLGYQSFCILEPRDQLVVVKKHADRAEGTILARLLGKTKSEVPFCPPNAQVLLKPHQATLKVDTWGGIRDTLTHFFSTQ